MIESADDFVDIIEHGSNQDWRELRWTEFPEEIWLDILEKYPDYKWHVIFCKKVPLKVLEILAEDSNPDLRADVAMKRKLTRELIEKLARDPAPAVRKRIACNRSTPQDVLQKLTEDEVDWVREPAHDFFERRFNDSEG